MDIGRYPRAPPDVIIVISFIECRLTETKATRARAAAATEFRRAPAAIAGYVGMIAAHVGTNGLMRSGIRASDGVRSLLR